MTPRRSRDGCYDMDGNPLTIREYSELRQTLTDDAIRVGLDEIGRFCISTVWFGIDPRTSGAPRVWETAVFYDERVMAVDRYTTRETALAGHIAWVSVISRPDARQALEEAWSNA